MAAHQAPPSLGFSRQEHWSGLPFPSPMHGSEKWKWSRSVVPDSSRPHGLQPTRLLHPWDSQGKGTGVGCHCLLQSDPRSASIQLLPCSFRLNKQLLASSLAFKTAHFHGGTILTGRKFFLTLKGNLPRCRCLQSYTGSITLCRHWLVTMGLLQVLTGGNVGNNGVPQSSKVLVGTQSTVAVLTFESPPNTWEHLLLHLSLLFSKVNIPKVWND